MSAQPSNDQLDLLREAANIGAGNAATALSELLGVRVRMRIPDVRVVPFHELPESVGGTEAAVMAMYFRLQGDMGGSMYVLMQRETAQRFVGKLLSESSSDALDSEMECSALSEVGNIVAGTYLGALSDFAGVKLYPSVPYLAFDMAGAVLSVGAADIGASADEALLIETEISTGDVSANTHVLLLPQPDQLPVLFQALGVSVSGR